MELIDIRKDIEDLWNTIAKFEQGEVKIESKNKVLANARSGARMEAYVKLFDLYLKKLGF